MWVSDALQQPEFAAGLPSHRVVQRTGELSRYVTGDVAEKAERLRAEGVRVSGTAVDPADFPQLRFQDYESGRPLKALRVLQNELTDAVRIEPFPETPPEVAAVDLSYASDGTAVACYAVVDTGSGKLTWSRTVRRPVRFPYISGFLSFREIPVILDLLDEVRAERPLTDVLLVDGNGRLHPRRAGIASHLGVLADVRTVGIGKTLLCGRVDLAVVTPESPQLVIDGDETLGTAIRASAKNRPVFASPGHRTDVESAARLARGLFFGHRVPEPIFHADAISRRVANE
jgi:deoxyribonuclease V